MLRMNKLDNLVGIGSELKISLEEIPFTVEKDYLIRQGLMLGLEITYIRCNLQYHGYVLGGTGRDICIRNYLESTPVEHRSCEDLDRLLMEKGFGILAA